MGPPLLMSPFVLIMMLILLLLSMPMKVNVSSSRAVEDSSRHMKGVQKCFLVEKHSWINSEMTGLRAWGTPGWALSPPQPYVRARPGSKPGPDSLSPGLAVSEKKLKMGNRPTSDWLVHQALNIVLLPLKTAASVGIMMNMPEESLLAGTSMKASPITTATAQEFVMHIDTPLVLQQTRSLRSIQACSQSSPTDYTNFLKAIKTLWLNGIRRTIWKLWPLSNSLDFHHPRGCFGTTMSSAVELDFRFSIIQTLIGYQAFNEGISKLNSCHSRIGPMQVSYGIRALLNFRYLAQALSFTTRSIDRVASALQEFHNIMRPSLGQGLRADWKIPKLELLPECRSGALSIGSGGCSGQLISLNTPMSRKSRFQLVLAIIRTTTARSSIISIGLISVSVSIWQPP
ncbi:hypothetical protein EDD15DRAFT_2203022 [Pisolithus albus]|nr:hypothetical protein EDD15DRAFT_2203022 [Pisolithus albus]